MTKHYLVLILVTFFIAGCNSTPLQRVDWQVVYHHDKNGEVIQGDKQTLIDAVKEGRPVRIVFPINDNFIHVMDAGFLTFSNGEVLAQTQGIIRQIPERPEYKRIALDAAEQSKWHAIFSTTGEIRSFQTAKGELGDMRFPLKWVVLKPIVD